MNLFTAALTLSFLSVACGGWSKKDTVLEFAWMPVIAADFTQTQEITARCEEWNPIIGACNTKACGPYPQLTHPWGPQMV
jgi:hypothetical protein